jgi:hypothetical protein
MVLPLICTPARRHRHRTTQHSSVNASAPTSRLAARATTIVPIARVRIRICRDAGETYKAGHGRGATFGDTHFVVVVVVIIHVLVVAVFSAHGTTQ